MFQNNLQQNQAKKNPGTCSFSDNKVRVQNLDGQSSVLFEDISSITWKKRSLPNIELIVAGVFLIFFGPLFTLSLGAKNNSDDSNVMVLVYIILIAGIGLLLYGIFNKKNWDDVIIETRGGLLLFYSVEIGMGAKEVDTIEHEKRKIKN
jgi:hypothetical protein